MNKIAQNSQGTAGNRRGFFVAAALLAIGSLLYLALYFQNIPFEVDGTIGGWIQILQVPWSRMLGFLASPVSESLATRTHFVAGMTNRIVESMVLKGIFDLFGDSLLAVAIYQLIIGVVFVLLVLWFGSRCTGNIVGGFLCSVFLLLTPAYGWCLMEYGDSAPSDQVLLLIYVGVFLWQFNKVIQDPSPVVNPRRILQLALVWSVGMVAIRAKDTNRYLVPMLSWLLVLCNPTCNIFTAGRPKRIKGFLPMGIVLFLLTLPIVLLRAYGKGALKGGLIKTEFLLYPLAMVFKNPEGWNPEETCALFSLKSVFPVSLASTFGFFLSWAIILGAVYLGLRWWRRNKSSLQPTAVSWTLLLVGWTIINLAFSISFKTVLLTRYLAWSLLPATLLSARILSCVLGYARGRVKVLVSTLLIVLVAYTCAQNLKHSLYIRRELEGLWVPKWVFRQEAYQDSSGAPTAATLDTYRYFFVDKKYPEKLMPYLWHHNDRKDLAQDAQFIDLLKENGKAYVGSDRPLNLPWKTVLLKEMDASRFSLLTSLKYRWAHHPPKKFYLYRVTS